VIQVRQKDREPGVPPTGLIDLLTQASVERGSRIRPREGVQEVV
jgi:hypothetical protein